MEKIVKVWFSCTDICILTDKGNEYRKRLEFYPSLKHATLSQLERYEIGPRGEDLHWEELDEDIHITDIMEGGELKDNAVSRAFRQFPMLDVSVMARRLGMHPTKLYKFVYGAWVPSPEREKEILDALREVGRQLVAL